MAQDPQSMPGTFCPLNKFGVTDYNELHLLEAPLAHKRQVELDKRPLKGSFDSGHLRKIHWYLFRDTYPWAGEFRVSDMAKVGGVVRCAAIHSFRAV
jgi:cell filamentation protein